MWAYRLLGPGVLERVGVLGYGPALGPGEVRLRLLAGGLCGSDMPRFKGLFGPRGDEGYGSAPLHEVVGEVVETAAPGLKAGQRVVGTLGREGGLAELVVAQAWKLVPVPDELDDTEAVVIQPLATVLRAVGKFPVLTGARAAVLGAGPIGLAFCHVLKDGGASSVSAIDPIERSGVAKAFGADSFHQMTSADWLRMLADCDRPQVVVEAVGHQQGTVGDAICAVAEHGYVFGFGEPDDAHYTVPYEELYLKDATLASGRTTDEWPEALVAGGRYLQKHRADFTRYVSHIIRAEDAQRAYSLYEKPQPGRLKVVIVP